MKISIFKLLLIFLWGFISVWLLIHFLAFFGIFLAILYPIFWLISPKKSVCLVCRTKKEGDWCPFCRQKVNKKYSSPKNLLSFILNGILILILSLISFSLVFLEYRFIFKNKFFSENKSVSFVIPTRGQFSLNETFPVKIEIVGIKTPINTVQTDIKFDPSQLELVDISTIGSFASIFIRKEINNEIGYARLIGGLPNPGFSGDKGIFANFIFKGKITGIAKIDFLPSSLVLANDKKGTNVLKDFGTIFYLILPEKISNNNKQENILGETTETDNTQMKFFDDTHVLGTEVYQNDQSDNSDKSNFNNILKNIEKFDRIIIYQWKKILKVF